MDIPHIDELFCLERDGKKYRGIAFDGCQFYLTEKNNINIFDFSMKKIKQVQTSRCYTSICYDSCHDCFWALSDNEFFAYRLNNMLCEIDKICLPCSFGRPTGISCSENNDELLITADNNIYCISKFGKKSKYKISSISKALYLCAIEMSCGYLCAGTFCYGSTIKLYNPCKNSGSAMLPNGYMITAMTRGKCCNEVFLLAVKDDCYYSIIRCCLCECECCSHKEKCCDQCSKTCCKCCFDVCCDHDESCCCKCKKQCYDKEQELCDIIESIALTEMAISHILNAEGEKLQKVIELTNDPKTLLETNKSIIKTIGKVTHLEYVLYEKLQLVQEMSDDDKSL